MFCELSKFAFLYLNLILSIFSVLRNISQLGKFLNFPSFNRILVHITQTCPSDFCCDLRFFSSDHCPCCYYVTILSQLRNDWRKGNQCSRSSPELDIAWMQVNCPKPSPILPNILKRPQMVQTSPKWSKECPITLKFSQRVLRSNIKQSSFFLLFSKTLKVSNKYLQRKGLVSHPVQELGRGKSKLIVFS